MTERMDGEFLDGTDPLGKRIVEWLDAFQNCVRQRDFEAGAALFAPEVLAFGTVVGRSEGLEELIGSQWQPIWNNTRDYTHCKDTLVVLPSRDRSQFVATMTWESVGVSGEGTFKRAGRCTFVLVETRRNPIGLSALHSHFSKFPDGSL